MDTKLLEMAIKSLSMEVELLKSQNAKINERLNEMNKRLAQSGSIVPENSDNVKQDELINLQAARRMLNIGRTSFLKLVQNGIIHPIRINLRTIRYSRLGLLQYIERNRI